MNIQRYLAPFSNVDGEELLIAAAGAAITFFAIYGLLRLLRRRLCRADASGRTDHPVAQLLKETLNRTSVLAVLAVSLLVGLKMLEMPPLWEERLGHLWFIVLGFQLVLYFDRAATLGARRYFRNHAENPDSPTTVANTLMVWALKTTIWVIFLLAALSNLGINVTALVASLGIGGIAVALAVQNVLGDLFASLSIAVDKPFEVGDSIAITNVSGTVEHVGLKTTRIRSDSGEQIIIGNSELLKNVVRNYKRMQTRRVQFSLKINPSTPAALAAQVPDALKAVIDRQPDVRADRVHLKSVTQDALEYELVFYVLNSAYVKYMNAQQAVLLGALEVFSELGVDANAPTRRLVFEQGEEAANEAVHPERRLQSH
ncbi:mechanosensitive ion channel family protein [Duganella sp. sic0402]|uniref:mechanosensitive ion channel family protein n=1 Tax=Duganella sp. sic0402 TaxID=2854786 RepID=UPI001C43BEB8|nr:mechanosensitive ion channel family protein [Duganella sp. sic0402]MBV7537566.1 mechanosensitive ion channel family protein [Duganella sp. sic0402]